VVLGEVGEFGDGWQGDDGAGGLRRISTSVVRRVQSPLICF